MISEPKRLDAVEVAALEEEYVIWKLVSPSIWEAKAEQDIERLLSHIAALDQETQ